MGYRHGRTLPPRSPTTSQRGQECELHYGFKGEKQPQKSKKRDFSQNVEHALIASQNGSDLLTN
jgi:hypothetical protein